MGNVKAVAAKGTIFTIGGTTVGGLTSIGGVATNADTMDATTLESEDGYREFIKGFKDGGEVPVSGYFYSGDAGQSAIRSAYESDDAVSCAINFPAAISASWTFNGLVTAFETGADFEDKVTFDSTIKVTGKPTLA